MATTTSSPGLSGFWRDLPREGQLLLSIVAIQFLGTGLVLPFHVVYLHEVRGFPLSDVGLLLGVPPLMGLLVVGPGGSAIDRIGARRVQLGVLSLLVVGDVVLAFATTRPVAALALGINGVAFGMMWPASQSLISTVIPQQLRQRYFGVNFTLINLGIGVGGIIGGFLVDVGRSARPSRPSTSPTPRRTFPPCCSCSARSGTSPARSRSPTTTTPPRWATSPCCAARRWPR